MTIAENTGHLETYTQTKADGDSGPAHEALRRTIEYAALAAVTLMSFLTVVAVASSWDIFVDALFGI